MKSGRNAFHYNMEYHYFYANFIPIIPNALYELFDHHFCCPLSTPLLDTLPNPKNLT